MRARAQVCNYASLKMYNCWIESHITHSPLLHIIPRAQSQSILVSVSHWPMIYWDGMGGRGPENLIFPLNFNQVTGHRLMARNDDGCFDNFFLIFSDKKSHEVATGARWGDTSMTFYNSCKILNWTFLLPTKSVSCKKWPLTTSISLFKI